MARCSSSGSGMARSASSAGRPTMISSAALSSSPLSPAPTPAATRPETPRPSWLRKPSTAGRSPAFSRAPAAIARAMGCSEASSTAPARRSTCASSSPSATVVETSACLPVVTVPVLSSTIVSTLRVDSSTSGPLMRMPSWAPRPVPTISAIGVARPSAHGQAMMSTATAAVNAMAVPAPVIIQNTNVAAASTSTTGTKMPEMRSARRCAAALPDWASSTICAI